MVKRKVVLILFLLWMLAVFLFSSQNGVSSSKTSGVIVNKVVEIITTIKDVPEDEIKSLTSTVSFYVRKAAHFSIYAVGGILMFILLKLYNFSNTRAFLCAVGICFCYAVSDETHQTLVSGRSGQFRDVCIDTAGATTGVIFTIIIGGIINKIKNFKNNRKNLKKSIAINPN